VDEKPFLAGGQSSPPPVVNNAYRKWHEEDFFMEFADSTRSGNFAMTRDPNP
jgi:hypothetical protein